MHLTSLYMQFMYTSTSCFSSSSHSIKVNKDTILPSVFFCIFCIFLYCFLFVYFIFCFSLSSNLTIINYFNHLIFFFWPSHWRQFLIGEEKKNTSTCIIQGPYSAEEATWLNATVSPAFYFFLLAEFKCSIFTVVRHPACADH